MNNDEQWLCQQNIDRFHALQALTRDHRQQATLSKLIAEEEAKLRRLTSPSPMDHPCRRART